MRLLFIEQPIPKSIITSWFDKSAEDKFEMAINALTDLRIFALSDMVANRGTWRLNKKFQENFKIVLFGGSKQYLSDLGSTTVDKHSKDKQFLTAYANERWDSLLHFMVGSKLGEVGSCVKDVIIMSGLMKGSVNDPSFGITERGFKFLLTNLENQILQFILFYFDFLRAKSINIIPALHFIFQLSFLSIDKSYPTDALDEIQQEILQHLREFGLTYQRKRTAPRFYITPLVLSIGLGHDSGTIPSLDLNLGEMPEPGAVTNSVPVLPTSGDKGFIVVETNFRLYAYTNSPLQTALLSLFSTIRCRFPNLVVADISRSAVRQALQRGITASQIINFLASNAHPDMKLKPPILPPTVVDQIKLWEMERDRFTFTEGCLYDQFARAIDFETVRDFAKSIDSLMWENEERRIVVVSKSGHDEVKKFWKQRSQ
ncbi:General transcription factor IIH subunit 4 [Cichlidogyrus casuarinus]|uniref:General transcription factor IIH subunit 4 n=1 Tax=Cichlidogyrus casuarinus TaxID=1844966 RepID=A0ABD2QII6_9PLAT